MSKVDNLMRGMRRRQSGIFRPYWYGQNGRLRFLAPQRRKAWRRIIAVETEIAE